MLHRAARNGSEKVEEKEERKKQDREGERECLKANQPDFWSCCYSDNRHTRRMDSRYDWLADWPLDRVTLVNKDDDDDD